MLTVRRAGCLLAGCFLICGSALAAAEVAPAQMREPVSWKSLHEQQRLTSGEFVPAGDGQPDRLRVVNDGGQPVLRTLVVLTPPTVMPSTYMVRGRVRYEGVAGAGYLEMWNHFPDGGRYFTRTLDASGPLGQLTGSSDWREFVLPFNTLGKASPTKLEINLVLPGAGRVEFTDFELSAPADELFGRAAGAWWSDQQGGLLGGVCGALLGILLGGVLAPLMTCGRARGFVLSVLILVGVAGACLAAAGVAALVLGQPYGVYYPLLLLGGLSAFFGFGGIPMALNRYRQHDLRRMQALDAA